MPSFLASLSLPRPSVRTRLTLLYGGLFLASGVLLLAINYVLVQRGLESRPLALEFAEPGTLVTHSADPDRLVLELPPFVRHFEANLYAPQATPPHATATRPDGDGARNGDAFPGFGEEQIPDPRHLATMEEFQTAREQAARQLSSEFVRLEQQVEERTMSELVTRSGIALAVMAVVSMGLGWLIAGRVLRPLKRITTAARRLSGSNLHERIRLHGPKDELKELADTFDEMLARLDAAFAAQRRFVANASHELRTPLTIVRTEVDVALADPDTDARQLRATAERVRAASERSERLIESLLLLARSERHPDADDPVDLASAAADALDAVERDTRDRGLAVETALEPAVVAGDRALLERLVANLVENAVRHNVDGGWVQVTTGTSGGNAAVTVANSGAVIAPEEVPGLLEPFRRRSRARSGDDRGAGLGLSIVRAVAERHGGRLDVETRQGGGLRARVELPAAGPTTAVTDTAAWYQDVPVNP